MYFFLLSPVYTTKNTNPNNYIKPNNCLLKNGGRNKIDLFSFKGISHYYLQSVFFPDSEMSDKMVLDEKESLLIY